ncbi:MAG: siroheme synthase CysG [Sneathiellaceae bacterium]
MRHLPINMDVADRPVLLVGGGEAAARKARLLLRAGAQIRLVAERPLAELSALTVEGRVELVQRGFLPEDLDGAVLAYAASEEDATDRAVSRAAQAAGVPVNVVDRPELSTFITPAIVDRSPIVVAISSGGAAPVLARRVRGWIEALLPTRLGRLASLAEGVRGAAAERLAPSRRRLFWERLFDGPDAARALAGDEAAALAGFRAALDDAAADRPQPGIVHIVGAGPGDPDLLTVRAQRLLQDADVIVHDKLVSDEVLDRARRDAERVFVGKSKSNHSRSQDQINALLAELAGQGRRVVRLKGGDPFVFGRGGEEVEYLRARGIAVEVVPGITAAMGCAAAAQLPLTHRDHAMSAVFITGHAKDGEPDLDWAKLAQAKQTIVVYMGVSTGGRIAERLIAHGMAPSMPVAVIENGTRPDQKVVPARLDGLVDAMRAADVRGPAVIVIGTVAALARQQGLPLRSPAAETDYAIAAE